MEVYICAFENAVVSLYLFCSIIIIIISSSSSSSSSSSRMCDRMQRVTTMVYSNLSRTTSSYSVPVTCASQCLPHNKLLKRHISDTRAALSTVSFIAQSYRQRFVRKFHVSCCQETNSSRQPDEQLVNI